MSGFYMMMVLPYAFDSMEPQIDKRTMEIHYDKHYRGYVDKFNKTLDGEPELRGRSFQDLLRNLNSLSAGTIHDGVRDFGGGVYNHELFWNVLSPEKNQKPSDSFMKKLERDFGSFDSFKEAFNKVAKTLFGSGWAWLCTDKDGNLTVMGTRNQDSPLTEGLYPILCFDVWEHVYYLKYQNRRPEFVDVLWDIINWKFVENRYRDYLK